MAMLTDFLCQVCDRDFEVGKLPGNHLQRRRICDGCREWHQWCNRCSRAKLHSDFYMNGHRPSAKQTACRTCQQELIGNIKARICAQCDGEFVVRNHRFYNGRSLWLCDDCYPLVKSCGLCGQLKPVDEFSRCTGKRVGRAAHCKACAAEKWSKSNHEHRTRAKRGRFGLSYDEYTEMYRAQQGRCKICGEPESEARNGQVLELAIDHDHSTGEIRGLLCGRCNKALGLMFDDPARLKAAADYLESFSAQQNTAGVN